MTDTIDNPSIRERVTRSRPAQVFRDAILGSRLGLLGFTIVITVLLMAVFAPELAPHDPNEQNIATAQLESPSL